MHVRRFVWSFAATGLAFALVACVGSAATPSTTAIPTTVEPTKNPVPLPSSRVTRIAVAYDLTGRGDGGFNDLA